MAKRKTSGRGGCLTAVRRVLRRTAWGVGLFFVGACGLLMLAFLGPMLDPDAPLDAEDLPTLAAVAFTPERAAEMPSATDDPFGRATLPPTFTATDVPPTMTATVSPSATITETPILRATDVPRVAVQAVATATDLPLGEFMSYREALELLLPIETGLDVVSVIGGQDTGVIITYNTSARNEGDLLDELATLFGGAIGVASGGGYAAQDVFIFIDLDGSPVGVVSALRDDLVAAFNGRMSGAEFISRLIITDLSLDGSAGSASSRRPANCAEARAMGLSESAAGVYNHLDRDGDGVACYGD